MGTRDIKAEREEMELMGLTSGFFQHGPAEHAQVCGHTWKQSRAPETALEAPFSAAFPLFCL